MTPGPRRARSAPLGIPLVGVFLLGGLGALGGCGDATPSTAPDDDPTARVASIELVGGHDQTILSGRRSPEPVRARATDGDGETVEGAVVDFALSGSGSAVLSQPRALTDSAGHAESYLLDPRSGPVVLSVSANGVSTEVGLEIERAPAELRFEDATGALGLPGLPHPDSVVRVQVRDREDRPMEGVEVWFVGPPGLSNIRDTTDAGGWVTTTVRRTQAAAGDGRVIAFVLGFPELTTSTVRRTAVPADRVVLVSVDGLRADAIERWDPPTLSALAAGGAFTDAARTVSPSLTTPAHLSLLGGVAPEAHGIYSEELAFTAEMASLEPLFRRADDRGVVAEAFMARGGPLEDFEVILQCRIAFGLDALTLAEPDAEAIADAATPALEDPTRRLLFLHLPDPDAAGHAHGFTSPEYGEAVLRADAAIQRIVDHLGEADLLVVTSDHGGGGAFGSHQHGSDDDADMRIPILLHGSRVVPGRELGEASILDVAPTVLWALGFAPPGQYDGEILLEGFR